MLDGLPALRPCACSEGPLHPYSGEALEPLSFDWRLQQAIYMEAPFPFPVSDGFLTACLRLRDANGLVREQLQRLRLRPGDPIASGILSRCDEIVVAVARLAPPVAPLVRWLETERVRTGPMAHAELIEAYDATHAKMADILDLYLGDSAAPAEKEQDAHAP